MTRQIFLSISLVIISMYFISFPLREYILKPDLSILGYIPLWLFVLASLSALSGGIFYIRRDKRINKVITGLHLFSIFSLLGSLFMANCLFFNMCSDDGVGEFAVFIFSFFSFLFFYYLGFTILFGTSLYRLYKDKSNRG